MYSVYVVKAENLPVADLNGFSDPFVDLYGKANGRLYHFGQTKIIQKNLNPVFDANCEIPFKVSFTRVESFIFVLNDYDTLKKNDYLGKVEITLSEMSLGEVKEYVVQTEEEEKVSKIYIKIDFDQNAFNEGVYNPKVMNCFNCYLTYSPRMRENQSVKLLFHSYDKESGTILNLPGKGTIMNSGLELSYSSYARGPSGLTNVAIITPKDCLLAKNLVPVCKAQNYKGIVTLNICGYQEGDVESYSGVKALDCDESQTKAKVVVFKQIPILVSGDGTYCFGCVIDVSGNEINVDDIIMFKNLQQMLQFDQGFDIKMSIQLIVGSPFCKFCGFEHILIDEIMNVVRCNYRNYNSIIELMKILLQKSAKNMHLANFKESFINRIFSIENDDSIEHCLESNQELTFLRDLVDCNAIDKEEVMQRIINMNMSKGRNFFFFLFMFFAPELDIDHHEYFIAKLDEITAYFSERGDVRIRELVSDLSAFRANSWETLKMIFKFGGKKNSIQYAIRKDDSSLLTAILETKDVNDELELSIFDPIMSFDRSAITAAEYACFYNASNCMSAILSKKPSFNTSGTKTIADFALRGGDTAILKMLLPFKMFKEKSLKSAIDLLYPNAFYWLQKQKGTGSMNSLEIAKEAITSGNIILFADNIKATKNQDFKNEFFKALSDGRLTSTYILLTNLKVNPNQFDENGLLPLKIAVDKGYVGMTSLLLSFPEVLTSSLGKDFSTPINTAVINNNETLVKIISSSPSFDPNFSPQKSQTPLFVAAEKGSKEVIEALLNCPRIKQNKAIINETTPDGETALFIATKAGNKDAVIALIEAGADKSIKTKAGLTLASVAPNDEIKALVE